MKYLDLFTDCTGCPVAKYCGTSAGAGFKLCNSLTEEDAKKHYPRKYAEWLDHQLDMCDDYIVNQY